MFDVERTLGQLFWDEHDTKRYHRDPERIKEWLGIARKLKTAQMKPPAGLTGLWVNLSDNPKVDPLRCYYRRLAMVAVALRFIEMVPAASVLAVAGFSGEDDILDVSFGIDFSLCLHNPSFKEAQAEDLAFWLVNPYSIDYVESDIRFAEIENPIIPRSQDWENLVPEDFPDPGYYQVPAVCFGWKDESDHWSSAQAAVDWAVEKINNYKVPKTEIRS